MTDAVIRYLPTARILTIGDNALSFGRPVTRYLVRNNAATTIYVAVDEEASTESTAVEEFDDLLVEDGSVTALHVYATEELALDDLGLGDVEVVGWAAPEQVPQGTPTLYGPYTVDYTDIPHEGDTKTLWTPQVGDVLLRLFTKVPGFTEWDHGSLFIGQQVDGTVDPPLNTITWTSNTGAGFGSTNLTASPLDTAWQETMTDGSGAHLYTTAKVFTSTDPVQIQLARTGGTDPGAGHVEMFALVARSVSG